MEISLVEMLTNIVHCILYHSTHKAGLNWESRRLQGGGGGGGDGGGGDGGGGGGGGCGGSGGWGMAVMCWGQDKDPCCAGLYNLQL